jgi:hypothetical protein
VEPAEPACPDGEVSHLNGLGIFAEVGEVLVMRIFTAPPDWRKIAFLLAGVLGLFLLGMATMWWRGLL